MKTILKKGESVKTVRSKGALLVALVFSGGGCGPGDSDAEMTPESADPFAMQVGACFNDTELGVNEVTEIPAVPCSVPHDNEVYAVFDLAAGPFPGASQVDAIAGQGCFERFEDAIGRSYDGSELAFLSMYPTEDSWTQIGDREVVCIAYHMAYEKLVGSVLGSGR